MQRNRPLAAWVCLSILAGWLLLSVARPHAVSAAPKDADDDKPAASAAATFEVYKDKGGDYRWRLRAKNSNIIATSGQGYTEKRSVMDAIESVKRDVPKAPVKEAEEGQ
jgi:uncharacterized protein YegP (UPF0339 family)